MIVRELATLLTFRADRRGLSQYEGMLTQARNMAATAAGFFAATFSFEAIRQSVDGYTTSMNRLGASTQSVAEAAEAYELLYTSARQTGIAVEESTKGFMRFSPAMRAAGFTMHDTVALLDGLQKGLLAAGAGTAETASVFTQLGQAVNSGVFQGEELNAFLENASPTLVEAFANALGIARSELKKLASEGKLTNVNVLPALIAAAKAGRDEFGRMRPTIELSMARGRVAASRFGAEFANLLRVGEDVAEAIDGIGGSIDRLRRYLPAIKRISDEFGGLRSFFQSIVALGGAIAARFLAPMIARFAPFVAMVIASAAIIQDVWKYITDPSAQTALGQIFGPFDQAIRELIPNIDELKARVMDFRTLLVGAPDDARAAWGRLRDYMRTVFNDITAEWPDWAKRMMGIPTPGAEQGGGGLVGYGQRLGRAYVQSLDDRPETTQNLLNVIKDGVWQSLSSMGFRQRVVSENGSVHLLPPGQALSADLMQSLSRAAQTTVNQTNNVNTNVTVNGDTSNGQRIGEAAGRSVNDGLDGAWARGLRMAIPGVGQ